MKTIRYRCPCGFEDHITKGMWDGKSKRMISNSGVWAFEWWHGTDKGKTCHCPSCGRDAFAAWSSKITNMACGPAVVRNER